jgi:drug/metabolite transporter (DMT)-like permease
MAAACRASKCLLRELAFGRSIRSRGHHLGNGVHVAFAGCVYFPRFGEIERTTAINRTRDGSRNRHWLQSRPRRQLKIVTRIMSWFFIALWAPFLLACANHNDKFLLSGDLKDKNIGSLVMFSSLFSGVAIPIVLSVHPEAYEVRLVQGSALVAIGILSVFAAVCYLYALGVDEASFVTPFYQTVPIFAYLLGYFILGETITLAQGLGSSVIIIGALALSFEIGRRGIRFKRSVVALMLGASFLSAINGVIFKLIAVDKGFWVSLFWDFVGQLVAGLALLVCVSSYRRDFLGLFKQRKVAVIGLIALSKTLFSVSESVTFYATLLAPVALVLLVNSFQPLFVFALGIVLTLLFPRVAKESLGRMKILQKGVGIGLLLAGGYLITR